MAAQDIATKQWGWSVGGTDTDATTVTSGQTYVKQIIMSSEGSADTFTITEGDGTVILAGISGESSVTETFPIDAKLNGIIVTMNSSVSTCAIFVM